MRAKRIKEEHEFGNDRFAPVIRILEDTLTDDSKTYSVSIMTWDGSSPVHMEIETANLKNAETIFSALKRYTIDLVTQIA